MKVLRLYRLLYVLQGFFLVIDLKSLPEVFIGTKFNTNEALREIHG